MRKAPPIGSRVKYHGGLNFGPCLGTVTKHYPPLESRDEWHVLVKVDQPLPKGWPYLGTDCFAPEVRTLSVSR